jgi:hypothetical protein
MVDVVVVQLTRKTQHALMASQADLLVHLDSLTSKISQSLTEVEVEQLIECPEFSADLQQLVAVLLSLSVPTSPDHVIEQHVYSSLCLLVMVVDIGHQNEEFSSHSMIVWKQYVKLVRALGSLFDEQNTTKLHDILMSYCEDGVTMLREISDNTESSQLAQSLKLLTFFVQRLSATLTHCRRQLSIDSQLEAIQLLFTFYGLIDNHGDLLDVNRSLRNNCRQSLFNILTSRADLSQSFAQTSCERTSLSDSQLDLSKPSVLLSLNMDMIGCIIPKLTRVETFADWKVQVTTGTANNSFHIVHAIQQYLQSYLSLFTSSILSIMDADTIRRSVSFVVSACQHITVCLGQKVTRHKLRMSDDLVFTQLDSLAAILSDIISEDDLFLKFWVSMSFLTLGYCFNVH